MKKKKKKSLNAKFIKKMLSSLLDLKNRYQQNVQFKKDSKKIRENFIYHRKEQCFVPFTSLMG